MADIFVPFNPSEAIFPASNFPQLKKIDGTNFPFYSLGFDQTTAENCFFDFILRGYGGSAGASGEILWRATTATTGTVKWVGAIAAYTPETDSTDFDVKAFDTLKNVVDTNLGATAGRIMRASVSFDAADLDAWANGDRIVLKIGRDPSGDTMGEDAELLGLELKYADS